MDEATKQRRQFWRPRTPELDKPCESCPFREGNDAEFGQIVGSLQRASGLPVDMSPEQIEYARAAIRRDVEARGEFICHRTAYKKNMDLRERTEHRQCAGASAYYRGESDNG